MFRDLHKDATFQFACYPGVACFNECCRMLELALTPYDVLRLKKHLDLSGAAFLEQYAVVEQETPGRLPTVFLGMIDDGRGSCPFVKKSGCSVYPDRPGACRTYPLGRGAYHIADGSVEELYVLLTEPHCLGGNENECQSAAGWMASQGLEIYNRYNDLTMTIMHHEKVRAGHDFTRDQIAAYLLGLYKLEEFRAALERKNVSLPTSLAAANPEMLEDLAQLDLGIQWVHHELFCD